MPLATNIVLEKMDALLKDGHWSKTVYCEGDDILHSLYLEDGSRITVLDRLTGFGYNIRDIESGYTAADGKFWLASGNCDVRMETDITCAQVIEWIKNNANTCVAK